MHATAILLLALCVLAFALVSRPLTTSVVTPPMAFAALGLAIGDAGLGWFTLGLDHDLIHAIAEFTLALILFSDASRISLASVARHHAIPVRLLAIALPLTIVLGGAVALALFPALPLWSALLLGAILAPTDAALGQAVVLSPKVPVKIRQALNVESGLNDGLALPAVLFLAACSAMAGEPEPREWLQFAAAQIAVGAGVGLGAGFAAGRLMCFSAARNGVTPAFEGLGGLAIALLCFALAELLGGNGFIATFAGGLIYGNMGHKHVDSLLDFVEAEGRLLSLFTFFLLGASLLPEILPQTNLLIVLYAIASLTIVRMLPTAVALVGYGLRGASTGFIGWFGPRGLASILFVLLIAEEPGVADYELIYTVVGVTVALSIILHGLTANPGANAYAKRLAALRQKNLCKRELEAVEPLPSGVGCAEARPGA
ncbi:MAG: cation:proton antiporter [Pseudomonadota bacterium]